MPWKRTGCADRWPSAYGWAAVLQAGFQLSLHKAPPCCIGVRQLAILKMIASGHVFAALNSTHVCERSMP